VSTINFYIGRSISDLDVRDNNVELNDELLDFICKKSKELSFRADEICGLNPYADTEIPLTDLPQIVNTCHYLLNNAIFENHPNSGEWSCMVRDLIEIAERATIEGSGLICIGD
jgi:hypothetical protein